MQLRVHIITYVAAKFQEKKFLEAITEVISAVITGRKFAELFAFCCKY
jgi:hypothetical protein